MNIGMFRCLDYDSAIVFLEELEKEYSIDLDYYKDLTLRHEDCSGVILTFYGSEENWSLECDTCNEVIIDHQLLEAEIEG